MFLSFDFFPRPSLQRIPSTPSTSQGTSLWNNHLGIPAKTLEKFFQDFLRATKEPSTSADQSYHDGKDRVRNSGIHSTYLSLHADFIDAGTLNHDRYICIKSVFIIYSLTLIGPSKATLTIIPQMEECVY